MRRVESWAATVLIALASTTIALADTHITMREGAEAAPSADIPAALRKSLGVGESKAVDLWLRSDRWARIDPAGGGIIVRLDRGEWYAVDAKTRTVHVYPLGDKKTRPPIEAEIEKTGETRTIGGWRTERYDLTLAMGPDSHTEGTLWIGHEVGVDLADYRAYIEGMAAQPGGGWMRRLLEIGGFPVRQEVTIGPITSWQELVSIAEEPAPAGAYEPPAGYEEVK